MRHSHWFAAGVTAFSLAGCTVGLASYDDGHEHAVRTFEADAVDAELATGVSPVYEAETEFLRLGLLWDDAEPDAIEVRLSTDGLSFGEWQLPELVHADDGTRAGHVDAEAGARFYQWRVREGSLLPGFVAFDPIFDLVTESGEPEDLESGTGQLRQALTAPGVNSRSAWGARAPKCRTSSSPYRVTIHHTVSPNNDTMTVEARLRQIQAYHMYSRGWCDIAYNYLVSLDGRMWEGRGATNQGGHTYSDNSGNVGIAFIGDHRTLAPSAEQECNVGGLLDWLHRSWPAVTLDRGDVKGHRERTSTACPGQALFDRLEAIIGKAKTGCSSGPNLGRIGRREARIHASQLDPAGNTDIDGDGRPDVCGRKGGTVRCLLAGDTGFEGYVDGPNLSDDRGWTDPSNYTTLRLADVDGDGLADLCGRANGGFKCWLSNGSGFGPPVGRGLLADEAGWDDVSNYATIRMADFNGDGRADLCARRNAGIACWPGRRDGSFGARVLGPAWSDERGWKRPDRFGTIRMGDVNGDGLDDICGRGARGVTCYLSDGRGFPTRVDGPAWSNEKGWDHPNRWSTIRLADVDGDGRADLCARRKDAYVCHLSRGDRFGGATVGPSLSDANGWDALPRYASLQLADVDGDGDLDLCGRNADGMKCWRWTGSGFGSAYQTIRLPSGTSADRTKRFRTIRLVDVTADGKADLCVSKAADFACWKGNGSGFGTRLAGPEWSDARGWDAAVYFHTLRLAGP